MIQFCVECGEKLRRDEIGFCSDCLNDPRNEEKLAEITAEFYGKEETA